MDSREIRRLWTRFFEDRGHKRIPSASLVPAGDPTLLFTSAGMVPFKPYMMGLAQPPAPRLLSIQKCFRTSDIEEVGNERNHTFFEMLGNFSIGDYFKPEVIPWAWELLTSPQPAGLGLTKERIWATIYQDDEEAFDLWRKVGIPASRIARFGEKENYWFAGPVGPCGPNSEINYDFGADLGCLRPDCRPNCENPLPAGSGTCDRFLELWNLVFMTLYQAEDGSRTPLPQKNVDTGAGLERWPVPLLWEGGVDWRGRPKQWKSRPTNYDTDLFQPLVAKVSELAGRSYEEAAGPEKRAMRIVAEHARAATFLLAEGVTPSNDGRGYVLRRLIRRATTFGQGLNQGRQFLDATAAAVIDGMAAEHELLAQRREFVLLSLRGEESRFFETLWLGRAQLAEFMKEQPDRQIEGRRVFYLWDTHGFPPELTLELLGQEGFSVADPEGFERELEAQRERSRSATHFEGDAARLQTYARLGLEATQFVGYDTIKSFSSVSAVLVDGEVLPAVDAAASDGKRVEVVLSQTPFYAEGGGQVGDRGEICWPGGLPAGQAGCFYVEDTQAVGEGGVIAHIGRMVNGRLSVGDPVEAIVDEALRADTMRNHTATHLLHAALRQVLGPHVRQAGSLVAPDRLRFDFTHLAAVKPEEIEAVEQVANRAVRQDLPVHADFERYEDALKGGALAFFGDKYAETVRVVGICHADGDHPETLERCFSKELCGGTHCHSSGEVGAIVITGETSIGAGMRRIEAVTGRAAIRRIRHQEETLAGLSATLHAPPEELSSRVEALYEEMESLRKRVQTLERQNARDEAGSVAAGAKQMGGVAVVVARVNAPNADFLRDLGDGLKARLGSAVILLGADIGGRPAFLAMATPDVAKRLPAGDLVRVASQTAGGGGGGRPELAQGGGTDAAKLDQALEAALRLAQERLS